MEKESILKVGSDLKAKFEPICAEWAFRATFIITFRSTLHVMCPAHVQLRSRPIPWGGYFPLYTHSDQCVDTESGP